ncbi:zinc ribbon domain-containing protein [Natronobacterium gregoryi]|uniref:Zinc-ribbon domain-containing protein n=2 Tax=Natronobacterium gregoryi TaxID=44930 RepID=L0ACM4_NATGS|nr:zinc-ribbon domain-containing protein [Natronobacterium gregoryi]AFZ71643.1 hypothetical protein Natgr_0387 [Natronobacterium gregoryi SP2]ELY66261.1 hypothetical protein C490_13039 [Natronobacterium gregoryi SP2]PLK18755.1 zinc-ribbon domain-containing protein [Natronobacterium gregoryi SP2]SFJ65394.1 zinc-ribbon domain-containing protein [Natronobacterium gregoryi]
MDGQRRDQDGTYCSNCGATLEPSMTYCPSCGERIDRHDDRSPSNATDSASRHRLESRIAAAVRDGWRLEHDFGDHAVMVRRTFGSADEHLLVALVTVWWTMGIGNVLYGTYKYVEDADRMVLRTEPHDDDSAEQASLDSHLLGRVTAAVCWLTAAVLAAIGVVIAASGLSPVLYALAAGFAFLGLISLPSVSDRLARRHSLLTNGRTRTVEERTVVDYDRPCTACSEPVGRGLERIYRAEISVFGFPVTGSEGRNYYCRRCANADVAKPQPASPGDRPQAEPETDLTKTSTDPTRLD